MPLLDFLFVDPVKVLYSAECRTGNVLASIRFTEVLLTHHLKLQTHICAFSTPPLLSPDLLGVYLDAPISLAKSTDSHRWDKDLGSV